MTIFLILGAGGIGTLLGSVMAEGGDVSCYFECCNRGKKFKILFECYQYV